MPNNFKLRGDYYVSKAGNDSNDGLTPDTPKLTVQAALNLATSGNRTIIVSSGVYSEVITKTWNVATQLSILGDGSVVFDGNNSTYTFFIDGLTNSTVLYVKNIIFRKYLNVIIRPFSRTIPTIVFENCIFDLNLLTMQGASNEGTIQTFTARKCTFLNTTLSAVAGGAQPHFYIYNSILINCTTNGAQYGGNTYGVWLFLNNYIDSSSILFVSPVNALSFNFNNIQGKIVMPINGAVSGVNSNGVALSFAQHRIDYPTYNVNSISTNPLFNNPKLLDFTLQSGSAHIRAASDFSSNIGGTEYAISVSASAAEWTTNASVTDLEFIGTNSYAVSSSVVSGSITSAPIFIQWPRLRPLTNLFYNGDLQFNKSITAGGSGNTNVPDWNTFTSASATIGSNPDRLTIKMRYSTQETQPVTDSEWDNGGYWLSGSYEIFEINTKPKVDVYGKGNGNPEYVEYTGLGDLVPSWIQLKIQLINNYI